MQPLAFTASFPGASTAPAPRIQAYLPEPEQANQRAIVIFPGGGYQHLAPHEGEGYAVAFARTGTACFVVSYRLGKDGHRHPAMLEDAVAAVHTVRARASEFGIDPGKVGVMGSSAGGHLAATLLVHHSLYTDRADCRPAFGLLCYPVISFFPPEAHIGSRNALLGEAPSSAQIELLSCHKQVGPDTPPTFLWHTAEDESVPPQNSLLFADALQRADVPVELHLFPHGRHGLGLGAPFDWASLALRFLDQRFA